MAELVWTSPLTSLPGVGPKTGGLLARAAGGHEIRDLLTSLPHSYIDRRNRWLIHKAPIGRIGSFKVTVERVEEPTGRGAPTRVWVTDSSGGAHLPLFKSGPKFQPGAKLIISTEVRQFKGDRHLAQPDLVMHASEVEQFPWVDSVWRLTRGLTNHGMRRLVGLALSSIEWPTEEWHSPETMASFGWPDFRGAMASIHIPATPPSSLARRRLAFDELFARQLLLAVRRYRSSRVPGRSILGGGQLREEALRRSGFVLTDGQQQAVTEICDDMARSHPMERLLQGDVGAGKTLVALMAMLNAVEAGYQAAIIAPTELLAIQHFKTVQRLSPVPVAFLGGKMSAAEKRRVVSGLADGAFPLAVGTHALIQEKVSFKELALAVIDEQHRFGVEQRMALAKKGFGIDLLHMSATPIPRSLVLARHGGMGVSKITQKPAGRKEIITRSLTIEKLDAVFAAVDRATAAGGRVYWICPMVEESEVSDLAAATERYNSLAVASDRKVSLAHGRQSPDEREEALKSFARGDVNILVSTTVVEVGVDVPEANVIVIEHAERFGVSQLHQLRGRVGRGSAQSYCLLLHPRNLSDIAKRRIDLLKETNDGFKIAEEDYALRGGGDFLGKQQAGESNLKIANPVEDADLLQTAYKGAEALIHEDPGLKSPRGLAARTLLEIFMGADYRSLVQLGR